MIRDETMVNCIYKTLFSGSTTDIWPEGTETSEIRADIVLKRYHDLEIWGYLRNSKGMIVENALVELHKVIRCGDAELCTGIAKTFSDGNGFFRMQYRLSECDACYRLAAEEYHISSEVIMCEKVKCGVTRWLKIPLLYQARKLCPETN